MPFHIFFFHLVVGLVKPATTALCSLMSNHSHFNFFLNIVKVVIPLIARSELVCSSLFLCSTLHSLTLSRRLSLLNTSRTCLIEMLNSMPHSQLLSISRVSWRKNSRLVKFQSRFVRKTLLSSSFSQPFSSNFYLRSHHPPHTPLFIDSYLSSSHPCAPNAQAHLRDQRDSKDGGA